MTTTIVPGIVHGKHSSYTYYRCRCADCRATHLAYMRAYDRRKDQRGTRWETVEVSDEARRTLQRLTDAGWPITRVAEAAGANVSTLVNFRAGRTQRSMARTVDGINRAHTVLAGNHPGEVAERTVGRVMVLNSMGWTLSQIADVAGTSINTLSRIINGKRAPGRRVTAKVDAAWERLTGAGPKPPRENRLHRSRLRLITGAEDEPETRGSVPAEDAAHLMGLLLDRSNMSQAEMADRLGIATKTVRHILDRKGRRVSDATMTALEELAHQEGVYAY